MFFKELFQAFRKRASTESMQEEMISMLGEAEWMFRRLEPGLKGEFSDEEREEFYERDVRINKAERKIRKGVVSHLTINPADNVTTCLILMSIVKDAERIGDYCKNAMDLVKELPPEIVPRLWTHAAAPALHEVFAKVLRMFAMTREAFGRSDEHLARKVVPLYKEVKHDCDRIMEDLAHARAGASDVGLAIGQTLLARFFRRISSHLENITSSVLLPVHRLDFDPEQAPPEQV